MTGEAKTPNGCLSCNREELEPFIKSKGITPEQLELVVNSLDLEDTIPPCEVCGAIYRVKKVNHSIEEDWDWIVQDKTDGSKEILGVRYPNGDRKLATDMPPQQWKAYLRKGQLKADKNGKLSVVRERN